MKKYLSFFKMYLVSGLQYRAAALAGIATQVAWGAMMVLLYRSLYLQAPEKLPMDIQALCTYAWVHQATFSMFIIFRFDRDIIESVRTGGVAYELLRPINTYGMWMAKTVSQRMSNGILRFFPVVLLGLILPAPYGIRLGMSPVFLPLFFVSLLLSLWVVSAICMLLYSLSFYLVDGNGLGRFLASVGELLSGAIVPLPFLPGVLQKIAEFSPFGALQNVPLRIFAGDIPVSRFAQSVGLQLFWAVGLTLLGFALMQRGTKRVTLAGG